MLHLKQHRRCYLCGLYGHYAKECRKSPQTLVDQMFIIDVNKTLLGQHKFTLPQVLGYYKTRRYARDYNIVGMKKYIELNKDFLNQKPVAEPKVTKQLADIRFENKSLLKNNSKVKRINQNLENQVTLLKAELRQLSTQNSQEVKIVKEEPSKDIWERIVTNNNKQDRIRNIETGKIYKIEEYEELMEVNSESLTVSTTTSSRQLMEEANKELLMKMEHYQKETTKTKLERDSLLKKNKETIDKIDQNEFYLKQRQETLYSINGTINKVSEATKQFLKDSHALIPKLEKNPDKHIKQAGILAQNYVKTVEIALNLLKKG